VVSIEFVFEQQLNFYHGYARQARTQLSRKVRIWLSRGGKTISAKKKIMMFLQVAALAALLARRIVILQICLGHRLQAFGDESVNVLFLRVPAIGCQVTDDLQQMRICR
jgi:hypothetical protein